jgi:hypothetical protein
LLLHLPVDPALVVVVLAAARWRLPSSCLPRWTAAAVVVLAALDAVSLLLLVVVVASAV